MDWFNDFPVILDGLTIHFHLEMNYEYKSRRL
jgi:hypothetical protein